jgi:adenine-specific DNA-methyltransferase
MAHEKLRPDYLFDEEKIAQLKQLAPECFEDGKINFETLRENLGDWTQNEEDPELEHFGLFWPGKRDARKAAAIPPEGTLEPVWGEGLKADGTPDTDGTNDSKNIFIEGENLEVLKLLQKSYAGKVKMIYIDPPYNTGNDFVYDDDFTEPLQEYLRRTGQIDEEGKAMTSNKRSDGRFHSKWLSMMYPRLRLASNLLKQDGILFVSIDDNEVNNLKLLLDEIFGEENFMSSIIVQSNKRGQTYKQLAKTHEYLLSYTKKPDAEINELEKVENDLFFKDKIGDFSIRELRNRNPKFGRFNRPNLFYKIFINPNSKDENGFCQVALTESETYNISTVPLNSLGNESCWRWGQTLLEKNIKDSLDLSNVLAKQKNDGGWNVYEKYRKSTFKVKTIWDENEVITEQGTIEIKKLGLDGYFDFPKPVELIKRCIQLGTGKDDIILDFFAGSSTTAHAVYRLNSEDDSDRKFICVQIPALISEDHKAYKAGFKNIADLSQLRIRKAAKEYTTSAGFACFKLISSNYKKWKNYQGISTQDLEHQLDMFNQNPLREGYTKDGLLSEVMLLEGFTLCSDISTLTEIETNSIKRITSEYCEHSLLVCLDETIQKETIAQLHLGDADIFICLDSAVSTEDKLRLSDKGLIKTI